VAGRSSAPQPFIGFADPAFGGDGKDRRNVSDAANLCRQGEPIDPAVLRGLPRLRESADEVTRIAAALGAGKDAVVTGAAATERRVREAISRGIASWRSPREGFARRLRCQAEPALAQHRLGGDQAGCEPVAALASLVVGGDQLDARHGVKLDDAVGSVVDMLVGIFTAPVSVPSGV
jgi:hypothetical protein